MKGESTLVRVVGAATVQAEPDRAEFTFGVVAYGEEADRAAEECAQRTRAAIAKLKERLGPDAHIQTMRYVILPNRRYSKRGPEDVTGYSVENTLRVTVEEISDLGGILDVVTAAGADQIYSVAFAVRDPATLRARAFREAVATARASAEAIAGALGERLVRIVAIDEERAIRERPSLESFTETVSARSTPIEAGTVEYRVNVILTAEVGP